MFASFIKTNINIFILNNINNFKIQKMVKYIFIP